MKHYLVIRTPDTTFVKHVSGGTWDTDPVEALRASARLEGGSGGGWDEHFTMPPSGRTDDEAMKAESHWTMAFCNRDGDIPDDWFDLSPEGDWAIMWLEPDHGDWVEVA